MLRIVPDAPSPTPSRDRVVKRAKPASGRNTIRQRFLAEATRELYERLGEADRRVEDGSVILRWDLGVGDGILVARKSTEEARNGETIGAQIQASVDYCDVAGHKPRIVVAVLNLSGQAHFENRHDFTEVFEAFVRGEASWVVYRGMDRVARSVAWTALFVHYLREYGIGLHIAQLHKEVDLNNAFEVAQLWMLAAGAELEAASSRERMLTAMSSQMRDAGKGWGLSGGFGFTRDEQKFIVVDDSQWPYVILIHEMYDSCGSIPALREELETLGIKLSQGRVHKVLRDERFLTGRIPTKEGDGQRWDTFTSTTPSHSICGTTTRCCWQDRTGKKRKDAHRQARAARHPPCYHARCMNHDNPAESDYVLTSRFEQKSQFVVRHAPTTPESCRGYRIDADVLERAVMQGIREALAEEDTLHRAIALGRTGREPLADRGVFSPQERAGLELEVRRLETYRNGLWQQHLDGVRNGRTPDRSFLETELNTSTAISPLQGDSSRSTNSCAKPRPRRPQTTCPRASPSS